MDEEDGADAGTGSDFGNKGKIGCHPVMKYWIPIPIRLEATQYNDRPLGSVKEKNAIISGISHSIIIWLVD